jgi:hypothetical protein
VKMVCKKLSLIQTEDGVRFWFQMRIVSKCNAKGERGKSGPKWKREWGWAWGR